MEQTCRRTGGSAGQKSIKHQQKRCGPSHLVSETAEEKASCQATREETPEAAVHNPKSQRRSGPSLLCPRGGLVTLSSQRLVQEDLSPLHWLPVYPLKGSTNTRLWESRYLQGLLCCSWNLLDLKEIRGRKLNHSSTGWSILIQEFWRLCCDTKMLRREILTSKSESKKARGPCVRCSSPCNVRAGYWGWKAVLEWLCRGVLSLLSFQFQFVKLPLVS